MSGTVYIGLAVTSHNNAALSTATFDNFLGSGFGAEAPAVAAGSDVTTSLGNPISLAGTSSAPSVAWQQVSGPGSLTFTSPTNTSTSVQASAAGSYRVRLYASADGIQGFDEVLLQFVDDNKQLATVELSGLAATYDGGPKTAFATTWPLGLAVDFTYNGSPLPPVDAGTYVVMATVNDPEYRGTATGVLTIAKAPANVALADSSILTTYNGSPQSASATTTPPGLSVQITYRGALTAPANAGSYDVVATITAPNYQGSATGSLTIQQATANLALDSLSQIYTGTPRPVSVTTLPPGLTVQTTYNGSPVPPVNPGTYTVETSVGDANYSGTASGTLQITKAPAVIILGNLAATYDGTSKVPLITTQPSGLATTVTWSGRSSPPSQTGTYPFVATVNDPNYEGTASGTLTISQAAPTTRGIALVDFGATATANPSVGVYWNNFTDTAPGYSLTNLVTTNNTATGFTLSLSTVGTLNTGWVNTSSWIATNATGLGLLNNPAAATDGLFVGVGQGRRGVKLAGLRTNRVYTLGLYGTRDASEVRVTTYTVRGAATNSGVLTNAGTGIGNGGVNYNNHRILAFSNVVPDTNGIIYVEYERRQGSFGYLNALSVEEKIPVPAGFAAWALARGLPASTGGDLWSIQAASGQPGFYHFAFDLPGNAHSSGPVPQKTEIVSTNSQFYFALTLPVRRGTVFSGAPLTSAVRDGIIYQVRGLADLHSLAEANVVEIPLGDTAGLPVPGNYDGDADPDYEYRRFRFTEPIGSQPRGFLYLNVWPSL